ncbi:MAG: DNA repair protein RecO [Bacteroidales bacterium]|nr:DNA repair protein RecO [Bacteroidales bacterium]
MKEKTEAIILQTTKYGDNKIIVNTYSRKYGKMGFAFKINSLKSKTNLMSYCQPLFQTEIEFNNKSNNAIASVSNISLNYTYTSIPFSHTKTATAMFIAEFLSKILIYSEKNIELFDYIATSLQLFDQPEICGRNFHIKFIIQISKFLGFYPSNRYSDLKPCFDLSKSKFTFDTPGVKHIIRPPFSEIFSKFLDTEYINCESIPLSGNDRKYLVEKIIQYYNYKFDNFNSFKSLDVLQEIFH